MKQLIQFIPEQPFLEFYPQNDSAGLKKSSSSSSLAQLSPHLSPSRTLILGDLHSSYFSFIQHLVHHQIIFLSTTELQELSRLTQSTLIDQLRYLQITYDETEKEITRLTTYLESMKLLLIQTPYSMITARQRYEKKIAKIMQDLSYCNYLSEQQAVLYKILAEKITEEINSFKSILKNMAILDTETLVGLLGDELSDRGNCDWKMLLLLQELKDRGINVFSLLSNHGLEFLIIYLLNSWELNVPFIIMKNFELDPHQASGRSLLNLAKQLECEIITREELTFLTNSWIASLQLLTSSYSEEENEITLYTHAPVGWETVKALAQKYHIAYDDTSPKNLHHTIEAINQRFKESLRYCPLNSLKLLADEYGIAYQEPFSPHTIIDIIQTLQERFILTPEHQHLITDIRKSFLYHISEEIREATKHNYQLNITQDNVYHSPLLFLVWNRCRTYIERPSIHQNGFNCRYVNGHHLLPPKQTVQDEKEDSVHCFEMDNKWGKPALPVEVCYTYVPGAGSSIWEKKEETETHIFLSYIAHFSAGELVESRTRCSLPTHYFGGIIKIPNKKDNLSALTIPLSSVEYEMDKSTIPTVLYDENCCEMNCLQVTNETFSLILACPLSTKSSDSSLDTEVSPFVLSSLYKGSTYPFLTFSPSVKKQPGNSLLTPLDDFSAKTSLSLEK